MEGKQRKRSTQLQLLQEMNKPKHEGRKSIFYAEGSNQLSAISTLTIHTRDQIQTRRRKAEVRVLRSQAAVRPVTAQSTDFQAPSTSRAVMKKPKLEVIEPESEESNGSSKIVVKRRKAVAVKVEENAEDSDDSDIQLLYDTKVESKLLDIRRLADKKMDLKLCIKCVRDSNEPHSHALEMINELLTIHEDFQADVIMTNCGKMMAKRVRKRKNGEGSSKENSLEILCPLPTKMEKKFLFNLLKYGDPGFFKQKEMQHEFKGQFPFPIYCEDEYQVKELFKNFTYIGKNSHKEKLPEATQSTYKCGCTTKECGSQCPCVQTSITVGGTFLFDNHIIIGGRVDGWTSALFTCGKMCGCEGNCSNSGVNLFKRSSLQLFDAKEKGWGVRIGDYGAETGRMLFPFVGEIITESEHEKRQGLGNGDWTWKMYRVEDSDPLSERLAAYYQRKYKPPVENIYIDPYKKGNIGRFVNSSELPNAAGLRMFVNDLRPEKTQFVFYATRTILEGEEILIDYGENYEGIKICRCGQPLCPHDKRWQRPGSEVDYRKALANYKQDLWNSMDGLVVPDLGQIVHLHPIQDQRQLCLKICLLKEQIQYIHRLKLKKLNVHKLKDRIMALSKELAAVMDTKPESQLEMDLIIIHENIERLY